MVETCFRTILAAVVKEITCCSTSYFSDKQ